MKELIDSGARRLVSIGGKLIAGGPEPLASHIVDAIEQIEHFPGEGALSGVSTGFTDLDDMTSGLQKGDLALLASAPYVGKTALALNLARNAAVEAGIGVAIFSPRNSRMELARRLLSVEGKVDLHKVCRGRLRDNEWIQVRSAGNAWPVCLSI
ncbi:MAG: hypothetical protein OXH63_26855 [Gemmatimonadetes bacterium]|nr:hypothetical protein [Gemmatimonadota bacterium]